MTRTTTFVVGLILGALIQVSYGAYLGKCEMWPFTNVWTLGGRP